MLREPVTISTDDDLTLEGELASPDEPWAAAVLTHPDPAEGGNMRSMVPGELITALPALGVATLRFNFRGVGRSEGAMDQGDGERRDVVGAVATLHELVEGLPLVVVGSSFGANTALTVADERISAWAACAPTLPDRIVPWTAAVAADERPKHLIIPARDQLRPETEIRAVTEEWRNTTIEVIPGTDHYFIGRIELVVDAVGRFLETLR